MKLISIARQTDLIFNRFEGSVVDHGDFIVVKTLSNPTFDWGNYIIFSKAPKDGDYEKWSSLYRNKFSEYEPIKHMTFTWDTATETRGRTQPFVDAGFKFRQAVGFTATSLEAPPKLNSEIQVREIISDPEWEEMTLLQILHRDVGYDRASFELIKRNQVRNYRAMVAAGKGAWYGAFLSGHLVGDLGIFYDGPLGRYQNIGTHPDFRRQGICGTLVYKSGQQAISQFNVKTLVLEAEAESHAAHISESVGFKPFEKNYSLSWWIP